MSDLLSPSAIDELAASLKAVALPDLFERLYAAASGDAAQLVVLNELVGRFASIATAVRCARIAIDVGCTPELLGDDLVETGFRLAAMKAPLAT